MAELLGAIAGILTCLCPKNAIETAGEQQCKYLCTDPKEKIDELRSKVEELGGLVQEVNGKLEQECTGGKVPLPLVQSWINNAQKFGVDVRLLLEAKEKRCLCSCFPKPCSRKKLGKLVENNTETADEFLRKGQPFKSEPLAYFQVERVQALPITTVGNETTKTRIQEIWQHLMADNDERKIGVYGIGGVGKTTIMKEINNRFKKEMEDGNINFFDNVIWIPVPQDSNTENLQKNIADSVSLDLKNVLNKAAALQRALERRKKLLLIFDNVWSPFLLEEIGIPPPTKRNGCKIVFTTRSLPVCRGMETDIEVEVKVLSEEESWNLFSEKVHSSVLQNPAIETLAREVAKELGGLPLAIITVGRALRKVKNKREWQNALTSLSESAANVEGMDKVYSRLRFSYEKLDDDIIRSCFLYCALYPERYQIEEKELIEYWMWEGLLGEVGTIKNMRRKGEMILDNLKGCCLLENVDADAGVECVKMHDLLRDMAINITKTSPRCLIKAGAGVELSLIDNTEIHDVEWISMINNDSLHLPWEPSCPKLSSLLLQYSSVVKEPPGLSCYQMPLLKVLDMSFTGIKSLDESIAHLKNLRALLLRSCWNLTSLPSLESLKSLWDLDLSYSPINKLPSGMRLTDHLKRLNLSYTALDTFEKGLLSSLPYLEELLLFRCQCAFGLELVKELITCSNIAVLEVQFQSPEVLDEYARSPHWNNLQSFRFDVSSRLDLHQLVGEIRSPVEKNKSITCVGNYFFANGAPAMLPHCTSELEFWYCQDVNRLSRCLSDTQLKRCKVIQCNGINSLVVTGENNLSSLDTLELHFLDNMKMVCQGVVPPGTFCGLKKLQISNCKSLDTLFTVGLTEYLSNLEELSVKSCSKLKKLIEDEPSIQKDEVSLPRLKTLELDALLELGSIYNGEIICNSLATISILKCRKLKKLPIRILIQGETPSTSPPIKKIKAETVWWNSVELANPDAKPFLHNRLERIDEASSSS